MINLTAQRSRIVPADGEFDAEQRGAVYARLTRVLAHAKAGREPRACFDLDRFLADLEDAARRQTWQ
jgi:hypothetical protein